MLQAESISLEIDVPGEEPLTLLQDISFSVPGGHFMAIVGPSGCGKSTLLKTVAGILPETSGKFLWKGRELEEGEDFEAGEVGYVPQFSVSYEELSVEENVEAAARLKMSYSSLEELDESLDKVLEQTGLTAIEERLVKVISGGQKRRLSLAMELVSKPQLLLCDEVTSGLDPRSEAEIVRLLHDLSRERERMVFSVTHSLDHLALYDSILVLYAGHLVYHGPPEKMRHYFGVEQVMDIYPVLAKRSAESWSASWKKHQQYYYDKLAYAHRQREKAGTQPLESFEEREKGSKDSKAQTTTSCLEREAETLPPVPLEAPVSRVKMECLDLSGDRPVSEILELGAEPSLPSQKTQKLDRPEVPLSPETEGMEIPEWPPLEGAIKRPSLDTPKGQNKEEYDKALQEKAASLAAEEQAHELPSALSQFWTLLGRRWKIFLRDRTQLTLQLAMILLFPLLVALFSSKGQDPISKLSEAQDTNLILEYEQRQMVNENQVKVGSAVSGIIMFEVILLGLMGSNNSAREIAGERLIFEKERYGGVHTLAYLFSKFSFLGVLVLVQSLWMFFFVQFFWPYRGDALNHLVFLVLANSAMTSVCLGISALAKTPDQASLLSIYLVGFQLPLSGAVLALPQHIESFIRPFVSAYWAWSGSLSGLSPNVNNAVKTVIDTTLSPANLCYTVLGLHIVLGLVLTIFGLKRRQWS